MITPRETQSTAAVAAHYDELSPFYLELWGEHRHHGLWASGEETPEQAVRRMVDVVAAEARIEAGSSVCDVGCGYGGTSRVLASDYGAEVTGLTISSVQLDHAR